ncbi:MAG TPA: hypothetical protein PLF29_02115 [bacterium]|nr:hypothetical protein [bacterium]
MDNGVGISVEVPYSSIQGSFPDPGSIVSFRDGLYSLSSAEYDSNVIGVIPSDSVITINDDSLSSSIFVMTSGETFIKVSGAGGNILEGDYITSSDVSGVGKKAETSGQVVGIALESHDFASTEEVYDLYSYVTIRSVYFDDALKVNLMELLQNGFRVPYLTPLTTLRYILASLIAVFSFIGGLRLFGKTSTNSIEALGRNPLASSVIRSTVVFNFILTAAIILAGLSISYLILVL